MPGLTNFSIIEPIKQIETLRDSKVLVFAASHLELELLPNLYEQLKQIGKVDKLDVVIHCRGGEVNAARRIALLLRDFCQQLSFIVPYYCQSSGTILTLAADEILAGELAMFSPIDPHLHGGSAAEEASSISCQDIRMMGEMSQDWFGVDANEARQQSLALLCESIFPPTLTAFYRTTLELQTIAEQLLQFQHPDKTVDERIAIIDKLLFGYHSHDYGITSQEMSALGLNCLHDEQVMRSAWQISQQIQQTVGGGLRNDRSEPWTDVLFACSQSYRYRRKQADEFNPTWFEEGF